MKVEFFVLYADKTYDTQIEEVVVPYGFSEIDEFDLEEQFLDKLKDKQSWHERVFNDNIVAVRVAHIFNEDGGDSESWEV